MQFRFGKRLVSACFALFFVLSVAAQQASQIAGGNPALPLVHVDNGTNSAAAQKAH